MTDTKIFKIIEKYGRKTTIFAGEKVFCSGEDSAGHPGVYIKVKPGEDSVKCSYCGRVILLSDAEK